jgi:hypothetical protein
VSTFACKTNELSQNKLQNISVNFFLTFYAYKKLRYMQEDWEYETLLNYISLKAEWIIIKENENEK